MPEFVVLAVPEYASEPEQAVQTVAAEKFCRGLRSPGPGA
jgi:hypothetical protein